MCWPSSFLVRLLLFLFYSSNFCPLSISILIIGRSFSYYCFFLEKYLFQIECWGDDFMKSKDFLFYLEEILCICNRPLLLLYQFEFHLLLAIFRLKSFKIWMMVKVAKKFFENLSSVQLFFEKACFIQISRYLLINKVKQMFFISVWKVKVPFCWIY